MTLLKCQESDKVAAEGLEMQHKCTNIRPF